MTIDKIDLKFSPAYAPQSSRKAEQLVQDLSLRVRVMMTSTDLPESLWAEAMHHGSYLQNKVPLKSVNNLTPISTWKPHDQIVDFTSAHIFRQPRFSNTYRPLITANDTLLSRLTHAYFVEMKNDRRLWRVFNLQVQRDGIVRQSDFQLNKQQTGLSFHAHNST